MPCIIQMVKAQVTHEKVRIGKSLIQKFSSTCHTFLFTSESKNMGIWNFGQVGMPDLTNVHFLSEVFAENVLLGSNKDQKTRLSSVRHFLFTTL